MDPEFWHARWREGRIGFHEGQPNAILAKHADVLGAPGKLLVPLCGKAEDLAFLAARGHAVLGVELDEQAARAFFAEHALVPGEARVGACLALAAAGVTILVGDFFSVTAADCAGVTAFYDRAAMIALPPSLRARYVPHLRELVGAGTPGLLVTLEYDQTKMDGPPFAVLEAEVRAAYGDARVTWLAESPPRTRDGGVVTHERAFRVVA